MMLDKVIEPDSLKVTPDGLTLGLRLPWYRALPLSTVEIDSLKIDGQSVEPDRLRLALNDGEWSLSDLSDQTGEFWFVTDTATLRIDDAGLSPGSDHEIEVQVSLYPPYIKGLRRAVRWARQMTAQ